MTLARAWVALCDRREGAQSLALVRIGVALAILWDYASAARLDLVRSLWAPVEHGGIGPYGTLESPSLVLRWLGATAGPVWALFALATLSALTLCIGLFTRTSALLLALASAQLALLSPDADRGIDVLLRNALFLLACSGAGATASLDARIRHGRFLPEVVIPAWPRYFMIVQLALLYFGAGVLKQSPPWTSLGGYSALYITLSQPHYASFTWPADLLAALYPLLQLATLATIAFERAAIALPLLVYLRERADGDGRVRQLINRARLLELWVVLGIAFHLGLAVVLRLGIFPWGCLALYPALAAPHRIRGVAARCAAWIRRLRVALPSAPSARGT